MHKYSEFALQALKHAAFEERINQDSEAADFWRGRASMWFRRAAEA